MYKGVNMISMTNVLKFKQCPRNSDESSMLHIPDIEYHNRMKSITISSIHNNKFALPNSKMFC